MNEFLEIKEELAKISKMLTRNDGEEAIKALESFGAQIRKEITESKKDTLQKRKRLLHKIFLNGIAYQEILVDKHEEIKHYGDIFIKAESYNGANATSGGFSRVALPYDIEFVEVFGGSENFFALPKEGNFLYAWGSNAQGCLGLGHSTPVLIPQRVETPARVVDIVGGSWESNMCGFTLLMDNGKVYSVGDNGRGEGGVGNTLPLSTFSEIPTIKDIVSIARSYSISSVCAINDKGELYVWGYNNRGCLGLGHTNNVLTPSLLALSQKVQKAYPFSYPYSEYLTTLFLLLEDGTILGAGYGGHGLLSQANTSDRSLFVPLRDSEGIPLKDIKELYPASVYANAYALSVNGDLYSFGSGLFGFGDEREGNYKSARKITSNVKRFAYLPYKDHHTTYQREDGTLKSFGAGGSGALGIGSNTNITKGSKDVILPCKVKDFLIGGNGTKSFLLVTDNNEIYACGSIVNSQTLQKQG